MKQKVFMAADTLEIALAKLDAITHLLMNQTNEVDDPAAIHYAAQIMAEQVWEARAAFEALTAKADAE